MSRFKASRATQRLIDEIVNQYDDAQVECLVSGDYDYLITGSEVDVMSCLDNFERNYSAGTATLKKYDMMDGAEIRSLLGDDLLWSLIQKSSEVISDNGYYTKNNEINSFHVGEYEHQIDLVHHTELAEALKAEGYDDDTITAFGVPCERLVLVLDPAQFLKSATKHLNQATKKAKFLTISGGAQ